MTIEKDGKTFAVAESLYSWAVCRLFGGTPLRCKVSKRQCPNYCDLQSFVLTSPIFQHKKALDARACNYLLQKSTIWANNAWIGSCSTFSTMPSSTRLAVSRWIGSW